LILGPKNSLADEDEARHVVNGSAGRQIAVEVLFMRRKEKLSEEQKAYLGRLCASDAALSDACRLTQEFAGMVRDLEGGKLDGWLEEADRRRPRL
jgi:hypothetical protein